MSKRRKSRRQRKRSNSIQGTHVPRPEKQPYPSLRIRALGSYGWSKIVSLSVLMSIIGTIYTFYPKVSVSSSSSFDPKDPFATSFVISNDSYLSILNVTAICTVGDMTGVQSGFTSVVGFESATPGVPQMQPGERASTSCVSVMSAPDAPASGAVATIKVKYQSAWIPWQQEKQFRFITGKTKDGQIIWLPKAVSE